MKMIRAFASMALALAAFSQSAFAVVYPLPAANSRLVGQNIEITVPQDNKLPLEAFAAQYQMGLSNMLEANPGMDVYLPQAGKKMIIPQQLILPDAPREGIVINSAEMRLYYYPKGTKTVVVLPIGIGELGKDTPINWTTTVQRKKAGPTWTPTKAMHAEYASRGENLPEVFPAGPDNPMGLYALYIGRLYAITAPTPTSVSACASATAACVCAPTISNGCLRTCRLVRACSLSTSRSKRRWSRTVRAT